jgi:hypothetical protein
MATATKKEKKKKKLTLGRLPWKAGASSGHTTNLKQSILETFDIYGLPLQFYVNDLPFFSSNKATLVARWQLPIREWADVFSFCIC